MAKKNTQAPAAAEVAAAPAVEETTAPVVEAPEVTTAPEAETAQDEQAQQDAAAEVAAAPAADGTVKLRGSNCSVDGSDYLADEGGVVTVLAVHAEVLIRDFGFERV